jgi:hypothetical protein
VECPHLKTDGPCPHLKTDGPCQIVRHCRFGWLAGGGVSTLAAYWLTQRVEIRAQVLMKRYAEREALYAEFIVEASKRLADGWGHQAAARSNRVIIRNFFRLA